MKHLFLDLEDTIITPVVNGWFNTHLINVEKIKKVISEFKPDALHVFSFAIWDEQQRHGFNLGTREMVERALGMKFGLVPTVDEDIKRACCDVLNISVDCVTFNEMSDFWGKDGSFKLFIRKRFARTHEHGAETEVMLLDDAVFNEEFKFPSLKVSGTISNIDLL
jgi:hypothetical protein